MIKWIASGVLVFGCLLALNVQQASADQIYVCQSCTSAPGGDPNVITNPSSFNVGVDGSGVMEDPLLLIVAVYNGGAAPTVTFSGGTVSAPAAGLYGLSANSATLVSGQDAFAQLGLTAGGSVSFGNLSSGDTANGIAAPSSFKEYAFALGGVELTSTPISIGVSGAPKGSYFLAYACQDDTWTSGQCTNGKFGQVVMTNLGLADSTPVPEPSAISMLGLGIVGLMGLALVRKQALG